MCVCDFSFDDAVGQFFNFTFFSYFTVLVRTTPEAVPMAHREGASFKPRPLGSHVAVRDGPSPARLTHCLAGADYRLEDPHRRGPCLQLPRRRWFSSSCGRFATNGVASLQLVDLRRSWVIPFQGCFEIGFSEAQLWWPCDFACLPARCPAALFEVVRPPCKIGMQWNSLSSGRPDRHQVCST